MKDDAEEQQYEDGVVVKTLGEVCSTIKGEKRNSKDGKEIGLYPLYYCSILGYLYLDTFDYTGEGIIINKTNGSGKAMIYFGNDKYNVGQTTLHFKSKSNIIITKYIYYYLLHNIPLIEKYFKGANQKSIVEEDLFKIKIPIPPLEKQQEIVKYLDFIYEKANKTSHEKIQELKQLNEFCLNTQKMFGENVVKTLGEVIKEVKTGKDVVSTDRIQGEYPFYGANGIIDYVDSYIFEGKYLLTARTGSLGSLHISNGKFWCSGDVHRMEFDNDITMLYIYYYLHTIDFQKFRTGSAHPKLSGSSLKSIKVHIPSLEKQQEIVEYCEYNDTLIKQLEKEIENNKKQAEKCITSIVKTLVLEEQDDTISVNTEPIDEITSIEEEIIIEPKTKVIIKKKVKKPLVIEDEDVVL
jgi:type I restriction enzyme S subunit